MAPYLPSCFWSSFTWLSGECSRVRRVHGSSEWLCGLIMGCWHGQDELVCRHWRHRATHGHLITSLPDFGIVLYGGALIQFLAQAASSPYKRPALVPCERDRVGSDDYYQVQSKIRCSVGDSGYFELRRYNWNISIGVVRKVVPVNGSVEVLT